MIEERVIEGLGPYVIRTKISCRGPLSLRQTNSLSDRRQLPPPVPGALVATPHVAFSVYLDHRETGVQIDAIIKFNKVLTNEGNAYNIDTGRTLCSLS